MRLFTEGTAGTCENPFFFNQGQHADLPTHQKLEIGASVAVLRMATPWCLATGCEAARHASSIVQPVYKKNPM
jgi:hypothetical protein